jgi:alkylhydroperoxidase/carboxymuconolactone decarboxylase family protein YurZ
MAGTRVDELANDVFEVPDRIRTAYPEIHDAQSSAVSLAFDPKRGALPLRIREIVAVVILAYYGDKSIGVHMRRAIAAGSTVREISEALLTISTPGGQQSLAHGLRYLSPIVDELGEAARQKPSTSVKARTGREVTPASPWPWLDQNDPEYQAIRSELNRLTFMPEGAALEPKYREMLVAAVLSCRRYPTVPQHARRAIEEGATLDELVEAMNVAAMLGGPTVFSHAMPFLTQIHDDIEAGRLGPR